MNTTLKKAVIRSLAGATGVEGLEDNKVVLATSMGLICGRPASEVLLGEESATSQEDVIYAALLKSAKTSFGSGDVVGNDGYLLLTDVTIKSPSGANFNVGNMVVFYDQIIGVSIGNIS